MVDASLSSSSVPYASPTAPHRLFSSRGQNRAAKMSENPRMHGMLELAGSVRELEQFAGDLGSDARRKELRKLRLDTFLCPGLLRRTLDNRRRARVARL